MDIQTNIPVPPRMPRKGKPALYPFAELPIGGSFAIAASDAERLGSAAKQWKKRHPGWNYCTRKDSSEIRLWRTA